jgi:acetyl-CoA C-acetyltransferase
LASETFAKDYANKHGTTLDAIPRITGWGHRTGTMLYNDKVALSSEAPLIFPHVSQCIQDAFKRAGVDGVDTIDSIETHDCFSITEYMAIDHFGITAPGESYIAAEEGWIKREGKIPINPGGGLMGGGHPVGATGVRMVLDSFKQVSNQAEGYQVEGAKRAATLNIGGSATTCVSFVVEAN